MCYWEPLLVGTCFKSKCIRWKHIYRNITEASRKDAPPTFPHQVLSLGLGPIGRLSYCRKTSNIMNQDEKLHRAKGQGADFLKIKLSFLFKILSMFETKLT